MQLQDTKQIQITDDGRTQYEKMTMNKSQKVLVSHSLAILRLIPNG